MNKTPIIAIIGPSNAGKSTLLNRLARRNIAITAREEGTTRDSVYAHTSRYTFIDTAGLKDPEDDFETSIQEQINDAIDAADLILVLLDGTLYPDDKSLSIVRQAQKSGKPYLIALNKSDLGGTLPDTEFRHFGEKHLLHLSATTGQGVADLKTAISEKFTDVGGKSAESFLPDISPAKTATYIPDGTDKVAVDEVRLQSLPDSQRMTSPAETGAGQKAAQRFSTEKPLKIALIGRPNVGKSSLFNTIGKKQQAIVSSRQGTTRDINRLQVKYKGQTLEFLDTAGLRKPGKREVGIEKFGAIRTLSAIEESDICLLLVDSQDPHVKLDQSLAGQIVEAGKSIILVVTKSDLVEDTDQILNNLERDFNFIPYAPVIITSSTEGKNITKIFQLATEIAADRLAVLKTSDLNKILEQTTKSHPPAGLKNTHPRLRYIVQTDTSPPWFVVYGSELQLLHWSYKRYLERQIRTAHPFIGTPIFFSFKNRSK